MKTKLLLLLFLASFSINAQTTAIPDINFEKKLIALGIDSGTPDGQVLTSKVASITRLDVGSSSIQDLTGIESFSSLTELSCYSNSLASLDVSKNTKLQVLDCSNNVLTTLNISGNLDLSILNCYQNKLAILDITKNSVLSILNCSYNKLTTLDLSNNKALKDLSLYNNQITSLDVSKSIFLKQLNCENNALTSLNVLSNTNLMDLSAGRNQFTSLDVSKNLYLQKLHLYSGSLTTLNVSKNIYLTTLNCSNNKLVNLDVSSNTNLTAIDCSSNLLATLDVSKNVKLSSLSCGNNASISTLNVASNPSLSMLTAYGCKLNSLDLSSNPNLTLLNVNTNKLISLNLSSNINLRNLSCSDNLLTSLDITKLASLSNIECNNNQLTDLNVSNNFDLKVITCFNNLLTKLDLSNNRALTELSCQSNKIVSLDFSKNLSLINLNCSKNSLLNLNLKNGKNTLMTKDFLNLSTNPTLLCVQVDDAAFSTSNWTKKDATTNFNVNCNQYTVIPDSAFENKLIALGIDTDGKNGLVLTANINAITSLNVSNSSIANLTGIEGFINLKELNCSGNLLESLDLSKNTAINSLNSTANKNLTCIQVANVSDTNNWTVAKDATTSFGIDCNVYTLIPDSNFEDKLISLGIDMDGKNGKVITKNISSVVNLNLDGASISNLTGIQDFVSLKELSCSRNEFETVDLSKNLALTTFVSTGNSGSSEGGGNGKLKSLDFSKNVNLKTVSCGYNKISTLNVSGCNQLTYLDCNINVISYLDITSTVLTSLNIYGNQITSIDVSKFPNLTYLDVGYNKLKSINVTNNPALNSFSCYYTSLTSIDISKCPNVVYFNFSNNPSLLNLNLKNGNNRKLETMYAGSFKNNPNLSCIQVDDVAYSNSNWSLLKDATANYSDLCEPVVAYTAIPDSNFEKKLIALGIDKDGENGKVATASILNITSLNVSNSNIQDLTGIKDFATLNSLDCSNNQLTVLDISQNNSLKKLNASKNKLSKLTLDKNTALNELNISNNSFASIDISKNINLSVFSCSYNNFILLNTASNTNLTYLSCGFNKLSNLDVSKNINLKELECSNNNIYNLNLKNGNNANMQRMIFGNFTNNPNLTCIQVDNATFSTANWIAKDSNASYSESCAENVQYTLIPDVNFENALIAQGYDSGTADGKVLTSKINMITYLNVSNKSISDLTGIQDFISLNSLYTTLNLLTTLDVSKNTALTALGADRNKLTTLDISKNTLLEGLSVDSNQLQNIDVSSAPSLTSLTISSNQISNIDLSNNLKLAYLNVNSNKFATIDLSKNTALTSFYCTSNALTSLNISKNTNLALLNVYYNNLTSLDVTQNTALLNLDCTYNKLNSIDVSKNKALTTFYCHTNKITNLDVSNNTALTKISFGSNSLKSVNLKNGNNTKLTEVSFTNNPNLSCIQVDDVDYANTNWSTKKDKTASFNVDCAFSTLLPDPAFEDKLIALGIDTDGKNGKVLTASISNIKSLDVFDSQINDLTGIEDFSSLESLDASKNNLTKIDLSKNQNLVRLNVGQNKLTGLNLINNASLQSLYCNNNLIKTLDLSKNVKLSEIYCPDNSLISLNLKNGNNTANNGPSIKNFTNNPNLTCIQVDDANYSNTNWLYFKDSTASYNTNCDYFTAIPDAKFEEKLIALGIDTDGKNGKVATSNIVYVTDLDVSSSSITNLTGIEDFVSLGRLVCKSNQLTSLDLSKNTALYSLNADFNAITNLNITNNVALTSLSCYSNKISTLDISKNTSLTNLDLGYNQLKTLNVSNHKALTVLKVNNNQLTELNLKNGKNTLLTTDNVLFTGNSLSCILVDDVNYAVTNWPSRKDAIATYNTECTGELILPANNFAIETKGESCLGENNGEISIVGKASFAYTAMINDKSYTFTNNALKVSALTPGVYKIKITIPEMIFEQNFNVTIQKGATITGKSDVSAKNVNVEITEGTAPFTVFVDGKEQFQTTDANFTVALDKAGLVEVATAKACEGVFAKKVTSYELGTMLSAYPNPTSGSIEIEIPSAKTEVAIELYNFGGQLVSHGTYNVESGRALLNLEKLPSGIYAAKINLETPEYIKIIKK